MPETLEAEVIAIDGKPPEPAPEPRDPRHTQGHRAFHGFRGRVLQLDRRWWPLWLLLGLVFGVFIIAFLILAAAFSLLRGLIRGIAGLFTPRARS
ncbi:MAG: hypothetical protein RLZ97_2752 [Verrucomicrobiota bacterium]